MRSIQFILYITVLLFIVKRSNAQENSIIFSYDKGGNLTERKVQAMFSARFGNFASGTDSIAAQRPELNIYPNPTSQYLTIEGILPRDYKSAELSLINSAGMLLKTDRYDGQLKTLDLAGLAQGLYILTIRYSIKDKSTYKVIITN